jgi:DNA-binding GntR family transcriptional regulator
MKHAFEREDAAAYSEGDIRIPRAFGTFCKNTSIIRVHNSAIGALMALRIHLFAISNTSPERSLTEHAQVIEACAYIDIQSAWKILDQHIQHLDAHCRTTLVKGAA